MLPDVNDFLKRIAAPDPAVRAAALKEARYQDPAALSGLADLMGNADKAVAKAAKAAMEGLVHATLAPDPKKGKPSGGLHNRASEQLLQIARSRRPRLTRAHAVHLLGFAGDKNAERALGALENDAEIGEDVLMARQRIRSSGY